MSEISKLDIQNDDILDSILDSPDLMAALRDECLSDFKFYVQLMFYHCYGLRFLWAEHHEKIRVALMKIWLGDTDRLLIIAPPQSGKSVLVVPLFSSWCFAHNSGCRFMNLSRSDDLVLRNSNECKMFIKSPLWQAMFNLEIPRGKDSASMWKTTTNGQYHAIAIGGQVTGKSVGSLDRSKFGGALIVDDPVKAKAAMYFHKERQTAFDGIKDAQSRIATDQTPIILAMQATHPDDPACRIRDGALIGDWEFVHIPALDENDTSFWPEKLTTEYLHALRDKDPYFFNAQYMGVPEPPSGGTFKREYWKYYKVLPKLQYRIVVADTAMKKGKENDYTVFACWGLGEDKNAYLIDLFRDKLEAPELRRSFRAFCLKHKNTGNGQLRKAYVEDKASGTGLIQDTKRESQIPVVGVKRGREDNKILRANDIVGYIESGYVFLPESVPWLSDFILEHSLFPAGKHDDQVDTTSDGVKLLLVDGNRESRIRVI